MATQKRKVIQSALRQTACIEIDRKKHMVYKIFAIKAGLKLKEFAEIAMDSAIKAK